MWVILKKDFLSYFNSFAAYISMGIFLTVLGLLLWVFPDSSILDSGYASLGAMFNLMPYLFMFLIPAVTMKSLAEEKKEGTYEYLATSPISEWDIVLGKYLASLAVVVSAILPTIVYYISVFYLGATLGNVDSGAVLGSYLGLILMAGVFIALGLLSSAITNNQMIAFVLAVFFSFIFFSGFDSLSQIRLLYAFGNWIATIGIMEHYQSISRGVLDSRDAIYFLSVIVLLLWITTYLLQRRVSK